MNRGPVRDRIGDTTETGQQSRIIQIDIQGSIGSAIQARRIPDLNPGFVKSNHRINMMNPDAIREPGIPGPVTLKIPSEFQLVEGVFIIPCPGGIQQKRCKDMPENRLDNEADIWMRVSPFNLHDHTGSITAAVEIYHLHESMPGTRNIITVLILFQPRERRIPDSVSIPVPSGKKPVATG